MKHPTQATLALRAGGDLGLWARWRADRHLAQCERCRQDLTAFTSLREVLPDLNETPELPWNRLASEMKANIRLGLAAGECVRGEAPPRQTLFTRSRAAVAVASVVALIAGGLLLEHPVPRPAGPGVDAVVVQSTAKGDGIQVREGGQALRLLHTGAQNVTYSVSAQGSMRARYVDPETGYVTINNVYATE